MSEAFYTKIFYFETTLYFCIYTTSYLCKQNQGYNLDCIQYSTKIESFATYDNIATSINKVFKRMEVHILKNYKTPLFVFRKQSVTSDIIMYNHL